MSSEPVDVEAVYLRLSATKEVGRTIGGGTISTDGDGTTVTRMWGNEPIMGAVNPDGQAGIAAIRHLAAERDTAEKALAEAREAAVRETVEACAKVAEEYPHSATKPIGESIARRIRALSPPRTLSSPDEGVGK